MQYDIIIGLEIHAELKTKSKMFCECDNDARQKKPNQNTCPICLGHPGTLPLPNKQAIEWTVLLGLALGAKINQQSKFDRKNYFYPDLPKGYQISQYDIPIAHGGYLEIEDEKIAITRIHLEEDTGKNTHPQNKNYSLIDFNRAGTPLVELVTDPIIKSASQAKKFCQIYQQILRYLQISNADMEKGEMRCEANVSIQEKGRSNYNGQSEIIPLDGYTLNPKIELKNINSFKAVEKAINYEINRQIAALASGDKLVQETRGWDENKQETIIQRVKETSADYRYFPEPDIPPLEFSSGWISQIKTKLFELPPAKKKRFMEQYDLDNISSEILTADKSLADYTENVISELRAWIDSTGDDWKRQKKKLAKAVTNWLISELFKHLKKNNQTINDIKITPENFAEFIALVYQGKISSSAAQQILEVMYNKGGDPTNIMDDLGLKQIDDSKELEKIILKILGKNPTQVKAYKAGKEAVLKYFIGQTMAESGGKANPKLVTELLKKLLK